MLTEDKTVNGACEHEEDGSCVIIKYFVDKCVYYRFVTNYQAIFSVVYNTQKTSKIIESTN
jgi:hypothetical protein